MKVQTITLTTLQNLISDWFNFFAFLIHLEKSRKLDTPLNFNLKNIVCIFIENNLIPGAHL